MNCPTCREPDSSVIDTRPLKGGRWIKRRRSCVSCGLRWKTYEKVAPDPEFSFHPRGSPINNATNSAPTTPLVDGDHTTGSAPVTQLAGSSASNAPARARSGSGSDPDPYPKGSIQDNAVGVEVPADRDSPLAAIAAAPFPEPTGTPIGEFAFSCRGKIPTWWLTQQQLAEWERLYPGMNILAECRKALAWTRARSVNRKTSRGMAAFLVAWLNRAADARPAPPFVSVAAAAARTESAQRERQARKGTRSGPPAPIAETLKYDPRSVLFAKLKTGGMTDAEAHAEVARQFPEKKTNATGG